MALLGPGEMSYLSPQTGPKRTLDRVTNGSLCVSRAAGPKEKAPGPPQGLKRLPVDAARSTSSFVRRLLCLLYSLHHPLPDLFSLIPEHLGLATDEVAVELDEFLGFFDANDFVSKVEHI